MSQEELEELVTAYRDVKCDVRDCDGSPVVECDTRHVQVLLKMIRQLIEREQGRME